MGAFCITSKIFLPATKMCRLNLLTFAYGETGIFGGGFYAGAKDFQGSPAGIIPQSQSLPSSSPGAVYVQINYRLGALGWLAGPSFSNSGGTPNAGLHDQRLALEWIQSNIDIFGGDLNRVTIMGASGGASSGLHQITAYGRSKSQAPFQHAFLESQFSARPLTTGYKKRVSKGSLLQLMQLH
jgi:carboxylesterase type B